MSAIASFLRIKAADVEGLREAAVPVKRFLRAPRDDFWDYMGARAQPVVEFGGSGYVFATLLPYLEDKRGLNLMTSQHDELAAFLSTTLESTFFFLTVDHRDLHAVALDPAAFDRDELGAYSNEFNESDEPAAGDAMMEGIKALRAALDAVHDGSVVLLHIG